jgi:hypothetical protein
MKIQDRERVGTKEAAMRRWANCSRVGEQDGEVTTRSEAEERRSEGAETGWISRTLALFPSPSVCRSDWMRRRRRFSPYTHWNRTTSRKSTPKVLSAKKMVSGDMTVTLPLSKE